MVAEHPLPVRLVAMPAEAPTPLRCRGLAAQGAGGDGEWRRVDSPLRGMAMGQEAPRLSARTAVAVGDRVGDEVLLPEHFCEWLNGLGRLCDMREVPDRVRPTSPAGSPARPG